MIIELGKSLKSKMKGKAPVFGPWVGLPGPTVVEVLARLPFDFLLVDAEHSSVDAKHLATLLPAADLHRMPVIFRTTSLSVSEIKTALDTGAAGVMIPMVETAEQAREIVATARYAPLGRRGIGPWRASGFYDNADEYLREANAATTLIVQIESALGLENVDAIASMEGVDVLFVGPADLASSLGLTVGVLSDELLSVLDRIAKAAQAHGKIAAIDLSSPDRLSRLRMLGYSLFTTGSDLDFLAQSGRRLLADLAIEVGG
ncbi:4-hydroxy-2-oxovalerate aldolase [Mesorhizobium sp. 113-3-9]|uniref:HpcH/HpaI aldolase family protein n=1 Tax=Mesorhizobium sp. 113-3-9 TaxID=2744517 RepID=UPI001925B82E|nr:aldolase/citrate lyase family protein [Mesorhizobium sp. 113-3-9]BCG86704.1 4-hydroxy-2-oxovalerate aldolase [Mesorhizobium sp. 113-3-9]